MATLNNRPLSTYPIPPIIQSKLNKAGFLTASSVLSFRPSELSSSSEISIEEAADVLELVGKQNRSLLDRTKTALEILNEEFTGLPITTMSFKIDNMFDGGVQLSKLTEIAGIAGVGKTQLCLQLCVAVQLPVHCGGNQGQAIFIDTEGSFNISRLEDMSEACIKHCQITMNLSNDWNLASITSNIFVFRCKEITELMSCVTTLKEFLLSHPNVKLIVIDSLAFHFRHDLENTALRSRVLHKIAAQLNTLAIEHQIAVVVTNQMTTKFDSNGQSHLTPALGTSWGHAPSFRLLLDWDPSRAFRWACLIKSSSMPPSSSPYQVTKDGIRDVIATNQEIIPPRVCNDDGIPRLCFDSI